MNIIQLDFFKTEEQSEIEHLRKIVDDIKSSTDKVRKKLFAENGSLKKDMVELKSRLEIIEQNICHPQKLSQS